MISTVVLLAVVCLRAAALPLMPGAGGDAQYGQALSAERLGKLVAEEPKNPMHHLHLGDYYRKNGFLTLAAEQYAQALKLSKDNPVVYQSLAQVDVGIKKHKEALAVVEEAQKRFPDNYGILLTAGYVYHNEKNYAKALSLYQKSAAIRPNAADAHAALADVWGRQHQFDKALQEANKALSLKKDYDVANFEKAAALIELKRYQDALVPLKRNFELNPLDRQSDRLYMQVNMQLRRPQEAFTILLCMLSMAQGKALADLKQGVSSYLFTFREASIAQPIKQAELALSKSPLFAARMHFALGDVFDHMDQPDKAIEQYRNGLRLNCQFARGYLRLGMDLENKLKDLNGAMDAYRKAYQLDRSDLEIQEKYTALSKKIHQDPWLGFCYWFHDLFKFAPREAGAVSPRP